MAGATAYRNRNQSSTRYQRNQSSQRGELPTFGYDAHIHSPFLKSEVYALSEWGARGLRRMKGAIRLNLYQEHNDDMQNEVSAVGILGTKRNGIVVANDAIRWVPVSEAQRFVHPDNMRNVVFGDKSMSSLQYFPWLAGKIFERDGKLTADGRTMVVEDMELTDIYGDAFSVAEYLGFEAGTPLRVFVQGNQYDSFAGYLDENSVAGKLFAKYFDGTNVESYDDQRFLDIHRAAIYRRGGLTEAGELPKLEIAELLESALRTGNMDLRTFYSEEVKEFQRRKRSGEELTTDERATILAAPAQAEEDLLDTITDLDLWRTYCKDMRRKRAEAEAERQAIRKSEPVADEPSEEMPF
jgi:hypothetical protein